LAGLQKRAEGRAYSRWNSTWVKCRRCQNWQSRTSKFVLPSRQTLLWCRAMEAAPRSIHPKITVHSPTARIQERSGAGMNGFAGYVAAGSEVCAGVLRRVTAIAAATVEGLHQGVHALAIERPLALIAMAGLKASLTVRPHSHVLNGLSHLDCRATSRCVLRSRTLAKLGRSSSAMERIGGNAVTRPGVVVRSNINGRR